MEPEEKEILALGMAGYLGQPRSVPTLAGNLCKYYSMWIKWKECIVRNISEILCVLLIVCAIYKLFIIEVITVLVL